jgi:hypothetical protein
MAVFFNTTNAYFSTFCKAKAPNKKTSVTWLAQPVDIATLQYSSAERLLRGDRMDQRDEMSQFWPTFDAIYARTICRSDVGWKIRRSQCWAGHRRLTATEWHFVQFLPFNVFCVFIHYVHFWWKRYRDNMSSGQKSQNVIRKLSWMNDQSINAPKMRAGNRKSGAGGKWGI